MSVLKEKLATGIAKTILRMQARFASYMNARTARLSSQGKKWFLFFVCLLMGGMSCMVLLTVFTDKKNAPALEKPQAIQIPAHVTEDSLIKSNSKK